MVADGRFAPGIIHAIEFPFGFELRFEGGIVPGCLLLGVFAVHIQHRDAQRGGLALHGQVIADPLNIPADIHPVVGMLRLPAQSGDVLRLAFQIADKDVAPADGSGGDALVTTVRLPVTDDRSHIERLTAVAAGGEGDAVAVPGGGALVLNIAPAEGAGVEAVFICGRGGGDKGIVKLGVAVGGDVKAAAACTHGALVCHTLPVMGEVAPGGAYWFTGMLPLIRVTDISMTKE